MIEVSLIHSIFCLTTGSKPPPKRFLHIVQSRASSFKWEYPLLSLRSSSSFLRLLVTSISPFIFPSITCFRRQFLCLSLLKKFLKNLHSKFLPIFVFYSVYIVLSNVRHRALHCNRAVHILHAFHVSALKNVLQIYNNPINAHL